MKAAKFYTMLVGAFFVIYGLYGAFLPGRIAGLMGFDVSLLGMHQIRALWTATFGLGVIIIFACRSAQDQRPLLKAMIFLMLTFAAGRCLGLALDGTGPVQTYYELGFEVFWAALGFVIYSRAR